MLQATRQRHRPCNEMITSTANRTLTSIGLLHHTPPLIPVWPQHALIQLQEGQVGRVAICLQHRQAITPGCQAAAPRLEHTPGLAIKTAQV
jgi:hypothetical protein